MATKKAVPPKLEAVKEVYGGAQALVSMDNYVQVVDIIPSTILISAQVDIFNNLGAAANALQYLIIWTDMDGQSREVRDVVVDPMTMRTDTPLGVAGGTGFNVKRVRVSVRSAKPGQPTPYQIIVTGIKF